MKSTISAALFVLGLGLTAASQENGLNVSAEEIIGTYYVSHGGENSKVRIFRDSDGTFTARVIWVENKFDRNGNVRLDEKNPDKSLRDTPCDSIVLIEDLVFNSGKKRWDSGKIYDPTRGIRANLTCSFESPSRLKVRGSLMGIGETVFWKKIGQEQ